MGWFVIVKIVFAIVAIGGACYAPFWPKRTTGKWFVIGGAWLSVAVFAVTTFYQPA